MGYRDVMGTSAPSADSRSGDRIELHRLVEEQAAFRRVATLVAAGAPPAEVFEAVRAEVATLTGADGAALTRYEADGSVTALSGYSTLGSRFALEGTVSGLIFETGRPGRIDNYTEAPGEAPKAVREMGIRSSVGAPIRVEGRLWGALIVIATGEQPLPRDTEHRLAEFADLFATAIANSEAHEQLAQIADEQAALRRVATLVAAGAPPAEVFEAVSTEVAALIDADGAALTRYERDGTVTAVSGWTAEGGYTYVGMRYELEGTVSGLIFETGRPGRIDDYTEAPGEAPKAAREMGWKSSVGAPITVDGRIWGALAVVSKSEQPLPRDTEQRLAEFAELFATAIANSQAHNSSRSSPTNRRRCDGWPRWSPRGRLRTVCSTRSETRWHGCSTPLSACCSATTPTKPRPCLQLRTAISAPLGGAGPSPVTAARSRGSAEPASRRAPTTPGPGRGRSRPLRGP